MADDGLFTALSRDERQALADEYVAFVQQRDGEPDLATRTLARREAWIREVAAKGAPPWTGEQVDPKDFEAWHLGRRPLEGASRLAMWLVAVARANEGEGWGVNYLLDRGGFQGLGAGGQQLKPRDFADLEETYHTRIFRLIVQAFGLDFTLREPPKVIQMSVKIMARLPERMSFMLLAAGELMGTVAFLGMAARAERLLADQPAMRDHVRALFDEILIDELGHVTYLLGVMSAPELAVVRRLAIAYLESTRRGYHYRDHREDKEIRRGISSYGLGLFPERVVRRAFVPRGHRNVAALGAMA